MSKRFITIVIDGFGIGVMEDYTNFSHRDKGANTAKSVLRANEDLAIPTLQSLGLVNAIGKEINSYKFSTEAIFGKIALKHFGADSFFGHQEIMGTKMKKPQEQPFYKVANDVYDKLEAKNIEVKKIYAKDLLKCDNKELLYLLINNKAVFADNMESMPGSVYNLTSSLDLKSFDEIKELAKTLREMVKIPRIIAFGGKGVSLDNILNASYIKDNYFGVDAPKSGVYKKDYHVIHLGYGIDASKQVPHFLNKKKIPTAFVGKVADIVENKQGTNISGVDTKEILDNTIREFRNLKGKEGYICCNIQETDLAGHSEDAKTFGKKLEILDEYLKIIVDEMEEKEMLTVIADHGNDPLIGHSLHTREYTPLLVKYKAKSSKLINLGMQESLGNVGKTVLDYFKIENDIEGKSFLEKIV